MRRSTLFVAALTGAAAVAISAASPLRAADSPAWSACQGRGPAVDIDRLIAGCTAVMKSPAEPVLRRALAAYQRGVAYAGRGDSVRAIADFDQAVRLQPGFAEAIERRAAAYAIRGDDARAIADYGEAIRLKPTLAGAYVGRAQAYFRVRDYDRAIQDATRALALKPDDPAAYNDRCWIRAVSGRDLQAALSDCNEAVRLKPASAIALDSRGFVHLRLADYAAAIDDYDAALSANPGANAVRASSLYGRGVARTRAGQRSRGAADIAAARAMAPEIAQTFASDGVTP